MPKSKRDKKVSLTQTRKKGLELKQRMIDDIRENVDRYARIFTFSVHNMRNTYLKDIRHDWKHSRFYFGKNKVMSLALGRTVEEEYRDNLHQIFPHLRGQTGLLFTNQTKDAVLKYFDSMISSDFARSGNEATQEVTLEDGALPEFSHSMEPQLRQLGLPTKLQKGIIHLTKEHTVCKLGQELTPEQARILKLFGYKMAEFKVTIENMWSNDGSFETLEAKSDTLTPTKVKVRPKKQKKSKPAKSESDESEDGSDIDEPIDEPADDEPISDISDMDEDSDEED